MQRHSSGGFTLIEVLVALFVLAIGVVGASAAQLTAQRTRQHAALGAEAVMVAGALAARMQANPQVALLPDASNPYLSFDYSAHGAAAPAGTVACFGAAVCDPLALAAFDLHEMRLAMHGRFPGGRIAVCRDDAPWDAARRRYRWDCSGGAAAPVTIKIGWHGSGDAPVHVLVVAL